MANQQQLDRSIQEARNNILILENILGDNNLRGFMSRINLKDKILTNPNSLQPMEREQYLVYLDAAGNNQERLRSNLLTELNLELDMLNTEINRVDRTLLVRVGAIQRLSLLSKVNQPLMDNPDIQTIKQSLNDAQVLFNSINKKYQNELMNLPLQRVNSRQYLRRQQEREERLNRPAIGVESWYSKYMKYKNKYYALKNQKN